MTTYSRADNGGDRVTRAGFARREWITTTTAADRPVNREEERSLGKVLHLRPACALAPACLALVVGDGAPISCPCDCHCNAYCTRVLTTGETGLAASSRVVDRSFSRVCQRAPFCVRLVFSKELCGYSALLPSIKVHFAAAGLARALSLVPA